MSCQIIIENSTSNFFPGGSVQGRIVCVFRNGQNIRGIRVKLRGREHTAWTRTESHRDHRTKKTRHRSVHYHGDNKFLQAQISLAHEGTFGAGQFEFPFNFTLPTFCPGSFRTRHGEVKYYLKATVDIPMGSDYESEVTFNVIAPVDFNTMPNIIMNPVQYSDEKRLCCCLCASEPITMNVTMDKEAFVLGETILMRILVTNMSNNNLRSLTAKLTMVIKETARLPKHDHMTTTSLLASASESGTGAHGNRNYELPLIVPSNIVLPNFNSCELFQMWCILEVVAEIPGCHKNMSVKSTITLGHVPRITGVGMSQPTYVDGAVYSAVPPAASSSSNPGPSYSGGSGPFPVLQMTSYAANAPADERAPSAPNVPYSREDEFEIVSSRSGQGQSSTREAPPSYFEAVGSTTMESPLKSK